MESPRSNRGRSLDGDVFNFSRPVTPQHTGQMSSAATSPFALPADQEAQGLITSFFSNTGYLFPFMHEETFMSRYRTMRTSTRAPAPRSWLGLLNIVFAMAVGTTTDNSLDATQRFQTSNIFYERALALCNREVLKRANIDIGECPIPVCLLTIVVRSTTKRIGSTFSVTLGPVSSRNSKINGSLVYTWGHSQRCDAAWSTVPVLHQTSSSTRARNS